MIRMKYDTSKNSYMLIWVKIRLTIFLGGFTWTT